MRTTRRSGPQAVSFTAAALSSASLAEVLLQEPRYTALMHNELILYLFHILIL